MCIISNSSIHISNTLIATCHEQRTISYSACKFKAVSQNRIVHKILLCIAIAVGLRVALWSLGNRHHFNYSSTTIMILTRMMVYLRNRYTGKYLPNSGKFGQRTRKNDLSFQFCTSIKSTKGTKIWNLKWKILDLFISSTITVKMSCKTKLK